MSKITRLEIKNCLGISELELQAGKVNMISGGNEQGKTSVLEVIEKGIRNTERRASFIRGGEREATLFIELDDGLTIERKIKADGKGTSKVIRDGVKVPSPETYLKSLLGDGYGFSPIDFMLEKDTDKTKILLGLIPMRISESQLSEWFGEVPPVNMNQHALDVLQYLAEHYFYDKRTVANTEARECAREIQALYEQLPDNYDGAEWREVNIGDLWKVVRDAQQVNANREQADIAIEGYDARLLAIDNRFDLKVKEQAEMLEFRKTKAAQSLEGSRQDIRDEISHVEADITDMEAEIKRLEEGIAANKNRIGLLENDLKNIDDNTLALKYEALQREHDAELKNIEAMRSGEKDVAAARLATAEAYLKDNPAQDIAPLEESATQAEAMKGFIQLFDQMQTLRGQLREKQENASHLDSCVNLARRLPVELLKTTTLPVQGLGINDQMQITIDGLPIANLSTSQEIRLALDIARATAGPLKLICVDRFESLDSDRRQIFLSEIKEDDYQYFITLVTQGDLQVKAVS